MKTLKFRKNLSKLILNNEKTTTWRIFDDKNIEQGDIIQFLVWETKEVFANAKILEVIQKKFKDLNDQDLDGHEKFDSKDEMYSTYSTYYNKPVDENTLVKIIKFELINEYTINEKIARLEKLQSELKENNHNLNSLNVANELAETLIEITKNTYNAQSQKYTEVRTLELLDFDKKIWSKLLSNIDKHLGTDYKNLKLLDVATGHGRDLKYALDLGFDGIGVDNSEGFIQGLKELENSNLIPKNRFYEADMRNLPFEDNSFDIVRHQASLVHMPIVSNGYTADKAIEESYRVLKKNGLLYILVKKGNGIKYVDTNEGLGGRIFQFYDEHTIRNLVERNGLKVISITNEIEDRKGKIVEWIMVIAQKLK